MENVIKKGQGIFDASYVMNYLINNKIQDPKSLIILCDKNGFVKEMTKYLWDNSLNNYLEIYVLKVNQKNSGKVLGSLLDLGAEESYIK